MSVGLDITVIIATYNRDKILGETLENLTQLDRSGIDVEFVVVDNNSTDNTKQVVEGFYGRLPVRYLFEPRPGQNSARNRALADAKLGEMVVFTDDDIEPHRNWLMAIFSASQRWPECDVFGGRIYPIWPDCKLPNWTKIRFIQELGYAAHDYSDKESFYAIGEYPSSGNFWVRREALKDGRRFNCSIEWCPKNRIMASETMFLRVLREQGHKILYCPEAVVGHKVVTEQLTAAYLIKRSYSWGRGMAHIRPLCRKELFEKNPMLWRLMRMGVIVRDGLKMAVGLIPLMFNRPVKAMYAMQWMGYNVELLNVANGFKGK